MNLSAIVFLLLFNFKKPKNETPALFFSNTVNWVFQA